jgi:hypothetical protein
MSEVIYRSSFPIDVSGGNVTLPRSCQAILVGGAGNLKVDMGEIKSAEAYITGVDPVTGAITEITLANGGFGYVAAPTVVVTSILGSGANITAAITNGVVTSLTIVGGGTGYSIQRPAQVSFTGGKGTGVAFTAVPAGIIPISVSKVYQTGTSATSLVALYI